MLSADEKRKAVNPNFRENIFQRSRRNRSSSEKTKTELIARKTTLQKSSWKFVKGNIIPDRNLDTHKDMKSAEMIKLRINIKLIFRKF